MTLLHRRIAYVFVVLWLALTIARYLLGDADTTSVETPDLATSAVGSVAPTLIILSLALRFGWRFRFVPLTFGVKDPYLGGRWTGWLRTSFDKFASEKPIIVEITHTAFVMRTSYYDINASNDSVLAGFEEQPPDRKTSHSKLFIVYHNRPTSDRFSDFHGHYGVMELRATADGKSLEGRYFNDPAERATHGHISLRWAGARRSGGMADPALGLWSRWWSRLRKVFDGRAETAGDDTSEGRGCSTPLGTGTALPLSDPDLPPPGHPIKGNFESRIYHTTDSPHYDATTAEIWFDSVASAEAAGFRAPSRRACTKNESDGVSEDP